MLLMSTKNTNITPYDIKAAEILTPNLTLLLIYTRVDRPAMSAERKKSGAGKESQL